MVYDAESRNRVISSLRTRTMKEARPGTYTRTKLSVLKNVISRTTGTYTNYGARKNLNRPMPSMPKLKCLEEPPPD